MRIDESHCWYRSPFHGDARAQDHPPGERGRAEQAQIDEGLTAWPAGQPAFPGEEAGQQRHPAIIKARAPASLQPSWPAWIRP
jgi:hypothetical protein